MITFTSTLSRGIKAFLLALLLTAPHSPAVAVEQVYLSVDDFLGSSFKQAIPAPKLLWLTGERKDAASEILSHPPPSLRVRYWQAEGKTAWILEEIGKEKPITTGVLVASGKIERLKVLTFRESRGWEVKFPFFSEQFKTATLNDDNQLDRTIDGISGATLSVRAVKKIARLALLYDGWVKLPE